MKKEVSAKAPDENFAKNFVSLKGKVTKVGAFAYTASGKAVVEVTLAIPQELFGESSVGYIALQFEGDMAEFEAKKLKIGHKLEVTGILWSRKFKNRRNDPVIETKVIVKNIGGKNEKNI